MATARQLSEMRAIGRAGRTVRIIQDGASAGLEKRYTGEESGFTSIKGLFKDKVYTFVREGSVERMRGEADEARAAHRERQLTVAHAALGYAPTETTRVVDAGTTYAVQHVDRKLHGEDPLSYTMVLRPV